MGRLLTLGGRGELRHEADECDHADELDEGLGHDGEWRDRELGG